MIETGDRCARCSDRGGRTGDRPVTVCSIDKGRRSSPLPRVHNDMPAGIGRMTQTTNRRTVMGRVWMRRSFEVARHEAKAAGEVHGSRG
jgi:hypothetical protein